MHAKSAAKEIRDRNAFHSPGGRAPSPSQRQPFRRAPARHMHELAIVFIAFPPTRRLLHSHRSLKPWRGLKRKCHARIPRPEPRRISAAAAQRTPFRKPLKTKDTSMPFLERAGKPRL